MSIVKMKKLTLAAPRGYRASALDTVQSLGYVHVIDTTEDMSVRGVELSRESSDAAGPEADLQHIKFTCDFLSGFSGKKKGMFKKRELVTKERFNKLEGAIDWKGVYSRCREIKERMDAINGEIAGLDEEIKQYSAWADLDVSERDLSGLKYISYFLGSVNAVYQSELFGELKDRSDESYVEIISRVDQSLNILVICHRSSGPGVSEILKKYGFSQANIAFDESASEKLKVLNGKLKALRDEYHSLEKEARNAASGLDDMQKISDVISSRAERDGNISNLAGTEKVFIMEGWIPEDRAAEFEGIAKKRIPCCYISAEDASAGDIPPTALKNNAFAEPFEAITSMYSLPLPNEADPTPVLAVFFMLFFGMMMADAGYGLVMAVACAFVLKRMDIDGNGRKLVKVIFYCSFSTIVFGLLYGSFFGGIISMEPLWVSPVDNTMDVLVASLILGLIHIFTGLGIKGYQLIKAGKVLDAIYDVLFWYALICGLIWLLLGGGEGVKWLSIVGALGLLLTQGRSNKSLVGKFFGGLYGLYGITSYLGDMLSYSRLLALGLSSGLIGWSFNLLIGLLGKGIAAAVLGPIIFVAGHTFNLLIGGLGTFVHDCRLQYLEFFGKFYQGGGIEYKPLKINTKYIRLDTEK